MLFQSIPGRKAVKQRLMKGVLAGKIPHAQLFTAHEGSGGLAMAIAYAQFLFCKDRGEEDSCGKCSSCSKIKKLIHPDLHFSFPFAASKKEDSAQFFLPQWRELLERNPFFTLENWMEELSIENKMVHIPVSECRQIIKDLSLKAYEGSYQILILWLPEFLRESANVLLKLLEEPSEDTLFILVTENRESILPTLLSRTQEIQIPQASMEDMEAYFTSRFGTEPSAAQTIAFLSEGNFSRAMDLVQGTADEFRETYLEWIEALREGNGLKLVDWVENFNGKAKSQLGKEDKKNFILYSIKMIKSQFFSRWEKGKSFGDIEKSQIQYFEQGINELEKAIYHLDRNSNPKILFLDVSLQLSALIRAGKFL